MQDMTTELQVLKVLTILLVPKWSKNSVIYDNKDIVRVPSGDIYQCTVSHTSADIYKPTIYPDYWNLLVTL
jgi:hypothetical protein